MTFCTDIGMRTVAKFLYGVILGVLQHGLVNLTQRLEQGLLGQIFRINTVRYAEGLWRMRRHRPIIAHCTDSEDFPLLDFVGKLFFYMAFV